MVDIPSITSAISGLKAAADIAKAMRELKDSREVQTRVIDLQSTILDAQTNALAAQSDAFMMMQKIRELENDLARAKAWEESKHRYKLIVPWEGCQVYALKESSKGSDPSHWICPHCYENGRRSMLHDAEKHDKHRRHVIMCPNCKFDCEYFDCPRREYV
ncbi:hypothetical protein YTPLAS18_00740 [Nitrospira sp.]|nr:hypothetical protein YTPLAS18_00740 [Nitrospira sp.]